MTPKYYCQIEYLKCLYARYRIRVGKQVIRANKGVAQGSIISPTLFNIFIEDLSDKLKKGCDIDLKDILFYADDLLVIGSTNYLKPLKSSKNGPNRIKWFSIRRNQG